MIREFLYTDLFSINPQKYSFQPIKPLVMLLQFQKKDNKLQVEGEALTIFSCESFTMSQMLLHFTTLLVLLNITQPIAKSSFNV